jgi:hypothetical protein
MHAKLSVKSQERMQWGRVGLKKGDLPIKDSHFPIRMAAYKKGKGFASLSFCSLYMLAYADNFILFFRLRRQ